MDSGASAMSSPTAVTNLGKAYSFKPSGTGPFKLVDYVPGSSCLMKKNTDYWGKDADGNPLPYLDNLTILVIPDQTVVSAALETGKVDVAILPIKDIEKFRANSNVSVFSGIGGVTSQITFNIAKPPMDNVNLRKAIAYAVDPDEANQAVYFGKALISKGDLWPSDSWAYDETVGHPYYDPAKAKEFLKLGGQPNGFTMEAVTYSSPSILQQAQVYQAQLAKVGIQVNLVVFDVTTATSKFYTQGAYPLFFNSWSRRPEPDRVASLVYTSNSFYNPAKLSNPAMDALVQKGASLYDIEQRKAVYHEISVTTIGDCWVTPMLYAVQYMAAWKKVGGTDRLLGWDIVARFKRVWIIQ
jgi:ABC-type transport system substrate-binding protein